MRDGWLRRRDFHAAYRRCSRIDKAMHGVDGRAFPMGVAMDPSFAKLRESRPEAAQPEPVGAFPLDVSPYGVRDLAGGATDWTATFVDGGPAPLTTEEDDPRTRGRRAFHFGGSWSFTAYSDRLVYAEQGLASRGMWIGFRIALSVPGTGSTLVVE